MGIAVSQGPAYESNLERFTHYIHRPNIDCEQGLIFLLVVSEYCDCVSVDLDLSKETSANGWSYIKSA